MSKIYYPSITFGMVATEELGTTTSPICTLPFSRFIPYGVYEAVYILDGLIENESDIKPDTIHGDTQSQNAPVFGLAYLLESI
jgi:hypothetical protein